MSSITAFGYSSFGSSAFGQSVADGTFTIYVTRPMAQVVVWYAYSSQLFVSISDVGADLENDMGTSSQSGLQVNVHFDKECYVLAIYLFDSDEDITYLYALADMEIKNVYPQLQGGLRYWEDIEDIVSLSTSYKEPITKETTYVDDLELGILPERNIAPSVLTTKDRKRVKAITTYINVEESY